MPEININKFVTSATNLQNNDKVDIARQNGTVNVVRASNNIGTKAVRWFRNAFNVPDPATKAFKAAVRRELQNNADAATVFNDAGIVSRKPLTKAKIEQAHQKLGELLANRDTPDENQVRFADTVPGNPLATINTDSLSDSQSSTESSEDNGANVGQNVLPANNPPANVAQPVVVAQAPANPVLTALPARVQDLWNQCVNLSTPPLTLQKKMECYTYLNQISTDLNGASVSNQQRDAVCDLVKGRAPELFAAIRDFLSDNTVEHFAPILPSLRDGLVASGGNANDVTRLDGWIQTTADARKPVSQEIGKRLEGVRDDLAAWKALLQAPGADRQQILDGYRQLGGKLLAAVLETEGKRSDIFSESATDGRFVPDEAHHEDVGGLLLRGEFATVRKDLLPWDDQGFADLFTDACEAFVKDYGGFVGVQAELALRKAGVPESFLKGLSAEATQDVASRKAVAKVALHGATMSQRIVDFTPTLARAIALRGTDRQLQFNEVMVNGEPLAPPDLEPKLTPNSIASAASMSHLLGSDFKLAEGDAAIQANGRTLRFTDANGRVVALKFLRSDENPEKLLREHTAFSNMSHILEGDFAATARQFGVDGNAYKLAQVSKDQIPAEAWTLFTEELKRGGLELSDNDGQLLCMSYEVAPRENSGVQPQQFFEYLEESPDDKAFANGFEQSMRTLGKMASKGYFNPNLIKNSYHDPKGGRNWVWSPSMFLPGRDNAGKEAQPIINAKWSNFRVGGLADPDEFRHISQLLGSELEALLGDKVIAGEIRGMGGENSSDRDRLLTTYLVGRMVHESLVIATRRTVLQGAFDTGTPPDRAADLIKSMRDAVQRGFAAFSAEFAGVSAEDFEQALATNGLDLEAAVDGMVAERKALYSFDYLTPLRENKHEYFGNLFGIDHTVIEFDPPDELRSRAGKLVPLTQIKQAPDPLQALDTTQAMGYVSVVAKRGDTLLDIADLGWMVSLNGKESVFEDSEAGIKKFEYKKTSTGGYYAELDVDDNFQFDKYMQNLKARSHELQDAGPFNGCYFFQHEQHANHILSSTLVNLRVHQAT